MTGGDIKLNSKQLRISEPTQRDLAKIKRREIYIVCDNILDTYNIGSIFRLADAAGAKKIYLCGDSEVPPNIKIQRAAVGTDKWVEWEYFASAKEAIESLRGKFSTSSNSNSSRRHSGDEHSEDSRIKKGRFWIDSALRSSSRNAGLRVLSQNDGVRVVAIEQGIKSVDYRKVEYREPIAFVVGHETTGVSKETLKVCDQIVEIPMYGVNVSLNVMVSLAIVLFKSIE